MSDKMDKINKMFADQGSTLSGEPSSWEMRQFDLSEPSSTDGAPIYEFSNTNLSSGKEQSLRVLLINLYCFHYQNAFDHMKQLVDAGMNVNMPVTAREFGQTRRGTLLTELMNRLPVVPKEERSCLAMVQLLLEHGADVNAIETADNRISHKEKNALGQAEFRKKTEFIQLLTKYGAKKSVLVETKVTEKSRNKENRDNVAEELKKKRRRKTTLLDLLTNNSGRREALKAAEKFHEENPTQKTALRFGSPKKSGRG